MLWQLRLGAVLGHITSWSLLLRQPWIQLLLDSLHLLLPKAIRSRLTTDRIEPWITETFARKHRLITRQLSACEGSWFWPPSFRDCYQTLRNLSRQVSRTPPGTSEIRYPYLDQTLVEFLTHIPADQLLRPGQRRSLMRRALANLLPPAILNRKTKSGLGRCFILVVDKHWKMLQEVFGSPLLANLGYVDKVEFCQALEDAKNGCVSPRFFRVLNCISAEMWLRDTSARGILRSTHGPSWDELQFQSDRYASAAFSPRLNNNKRPQEQRFFRRRKIPLSHRKEVK